MISSFPWETIKTYEDILFQFYNGIAKISINRPHKHNAFTPLTVQEMSEAMELARQDTRVGVIILTGEEAKPSVLVAIKAFAEMVDMSEKMRSHA